MKAVVSISIEDSNVVLTLTYEEARLLHRIIEDWFHINAKRVDGEVEDFALKLGDRLLDVVDKNKQWIIEPPKLPLWVIKR